MHRHLPGLIEASVAAHAPLPALRIKRDGRWHITTYGELGEQVGRVAAALVARGVRPGDRVAIFATNRPEWTVLDLAILRAGAVTVTVYSTATSEQVAFTLADSGAVAVACGGPSEVERVAAVADRLPDLRDVIVFDGAEAPAGPAVLGAAGTPADGRAAAAPADGRAAAAPIPFADLTGRVPEAADLAEITRRLDGLGPESLATIIYTSGTTGEPKGAMLTHGNLLAQLAAIRARFAIPAGERNMSFLPLSHALERGWTLVMLDHGVENVSVADPRTVAEAMVEIQPQLFVSVPRLYEKVFAVAHEQAGEGATRRIFDWALGVGHDVARRRAAGRLVPPHLRAAHAVADRLVLHRIRDAVGGPKTVMASGGAPLRPEVIEFFAAGGLAVYEGYGLTETAPMISCNCPDGLRIGSVGRPIPGCEVRIGDADEIQAQGPNVFVGYWGRPDLDAEALVDGWFRTGDVGRVDEDGFLYVTDRLKDLIITAQGKNIAPAPLEARLTADPLVESVVVVGDDRKYLVALVQPSFPQLESYAAARGWVAADRAALVALPQVKELYDGKVAAAGAGLAHYEQIQKFRLLPEELTMDAGELTPTLKVRRRLVEERYAGLVEDMYGPHGARA